MIGHLICRLNKPNHYVDLKFKTTRVTIIEYTKTDEYEIQNINIFYDIRVDSL